MNEIEFYLEDLKSRFNKIKPNTYYLSYSGGKDSHFLYWFIKEYLKRDDIKIVSINTYMEHHEILTRMKKNSDIVLMPKMKPMEIKKAYGIPCFSKSQDNVINEYQKGNRKEWVVDRIERKDTKTHFTINKRATKLLKENKLHKISPMCCKKLKKEVAKAYEKESGLKPILGVRASESALRKSQYTSCFTKDMKFTPIYDLNEHLLDKIYEKYKIELPNVYNYVTRTGCMGCPYGSYVHDTQKELMLINDNQFNFVCEYFKESYEVLGIDINFIKMQRIIKDLRK